MKFTMTHFLNLEDEIDIKGVFVGQHQDFIPMGFIKFWGSFEQMDDRVNETFINHILYEGQADHTGKNGFGRLFIN